MNITFALLMALAIAGETELEARARLAGEYDAEVGVVLEDGTECDLISDRYALDVARAADWRAAVGQSLLCASWANREPGVILLRRRPDDETAVWRCGLACQRAGIHLFLEDEMTASIVGRHIFYPGSYYGDDIDTSKAALLPGGTGGFANYISWYRVPAGTAAIGGIYVDVADLGNPGAITAADFAFAYGNDNDPTGWQTAAAPSAVTVAAGAGVGGSDRIKIEWTASAIPNSNWLQVTVLANANTGLASPDVHYWGLACGDTGDSEADAIVDVDDRDLVYAAIEKVPDAQPITCPYDIDRDGHVLYDDVSAVYTHYTTEETALQLITVPLGPVAGPYGVEAGEVFHAASVAGQSFTAGRQAGEVFHAASVAGQSFTAGRQAGEVFHTGAAAGQIAR